MKTKAFILVIITGILWGTSGIFVNHLATFGLTSFQMTALRGLLSCLLLWGWALIRDRSLIRVRWQNLALFALIGASLFGTSGFYFWSLQASSISTAVVLMYTAPIYVMLVSVLFLGERFSALKGVSLGCMLMGCVLVSGLIGGMNLNGVGLAMGFLSGISFAAYNIFTKIAMQKGCRPMSVTLYSFLFMTMIAIAVSKPQQVVPILREDLWEILGWIALFAAITFILPYTLYTVAMRTLPAGTASSLGIVEPMAATLVGVLVFDERLTVLAAMGMILILSAVFLLGVAENRAQMREKKEERINDKEGEIQ